MNRVNPSYIPGLFLFWAGNLKVRLNLARAALPKESGQGAFSTNAETFDFPPRLLFFELNPHSLARMTALLPAALATVAYGTTAVALTLIAFKSRTIYQIIKSGQPDPTRGGNPAERARTMTSQILLHTKMNRFTPSGFAHWFVMIGFFALAGSLIQAYGEILSPSYHLPIIGHWIIYRAFVVLIGALTGLGILTLIGVRFTNMYIRKGRANRFEGSVTWRGIYVETTILAIVACVFILHIFGDNSSIIHQLP